MLHLQRPLVFIDLETTGLDRENDRIVQIAMLKVFSLGEMINPNQMDGRQTSLWSTLVNPERPIPEAATAIHGINTSDVLAVEPFRTIAPEVLAFLNGCDIAGFGSNYYDVPLLFHEFSRAGIHWQPGHLIDVGNLFKIQESRTLSAAVKFYTGEVHSSAHSALGDVLATALVFQAQLQRYALPGTVEELALFTNHGNRMADISGKFYYDPEGVIRFGFGKYKDEPALNHIDFLEWMYYKASFPIDTNAILADLLANVGTAEDEDPFGQLAY